VIGEDDTIELVPGWRRGGTFVDARLALRHGVIMLGRLQARAAGLQVRCGQTEFQFSEKSQKKATGGSKPPMALRRMVNNRSGRSE
jgi:hypothetical protein